MQDNNNEFSDSQNIQYGAQWDLVRHGGPPPPPLRGNNYVAPKGDPEVRSRNKRRAERLVPYMVPYRWTSPNTTSFTYATGNHEQDSDQPRQQGRMRTFNTDPKHPAPVCFVRPGLTEVMLGLSGGGASLNHMFVIQHRSSKKTIDALNAAQKGQPLDQLAKKKAESEAEGFRHAIFNDEAYKLKSEAEKIKQLEELLNRQTWRANHLEDQTRLDKVTIADQKGQILDLLSQKSGLEKNIQSLIEPGSVIRTDLEMMHQQTLKSLARLQTVAASILAKIGHHAPPEFVRIEQLLSKAGEPGASKALRLTKEELHAGMKKVYAEERLYDTFRKPIESLNALNKTLAGWDPQKRLAEDFQKAANSVEWVQPPKHDLLHIIGIVANRSLSEGFDLGRATLSKHKKALINNGFAKGVGTGEAILQDKVDRLTDVPLETLHADISSKYFHYGVRYALCIEAEARAGERLLTQAQHDLATSVGLMYVELIFERRVRGLSVDYAIDFLGKPGQAVKVPSAGLVLDNDYLKATRGHLGAMGAEYDQGRPRIYARLERKPLHVSVADLRFFKDDLNLSRAEIAAWENQAHETSLAELADELNAAEAV